MKSFDINKHIFEGDHIIDPLDGEERTISGFVVHSVDEASVNLTDGGVMNISEIKYDTINEDKFGAQGRGPDAEDFE